MEGTWNLSQLIKWHPIKNRNVNVLPHLESNHSRLIQEIEINVTIVQPIMMDSGL